MQPLRVEPHDDRLVVVLMVHAGEQSVRRGRYVVGVVLVRQSRQKERLLVLHLSGRLRDALFAPVHQTTWNRRELGPRGLGHLGLLLSGQ